MSLFDEQNNKLKKVIKRYNLDKLSAITVEATEINDVVDNLKTLTSTASQIDAGIAKANSIQDVSTVATGLIEATIENVSLFSTTIASGGSSNLSVVKDSDGALFTQLTATNAYAIFDIKNTVLSGEKYQIVLDYEVVDLNCTSVQIGVQPYFVDSITQTTMVTAEQVGKRNTFTLKSVTANGTNFTCGVKTLISGSKIDTNKAYYAIVRIRKVSVIKYADIFQNIQSIPRVIPNIIEGTKNIWGLEKQNFDKFTTASNFLNYNIARFDNIENTKNIIGRTFEINSTTTNKDTAITSIVPTSLTGQKAYVYTKIKILLNALNADIFKLGVRLVSGADSFIEFTRADIGVEKEYTIVNEFQTISALNHYLLIATSRVYTNGVANIGFDGGSPTANFTLTDYSSYVSQKLLPINYQRSFFKENHTEDLIVGYVKEPITNLIINEYGDSISEQNYLKYMGVNGYDFKINIYGLRGPVSDINGDGLGACNTYSVMTNTADIVIVMFGTHDFGKNVPLGTIGTLDDNTYIGAYEKLLQGLLVKYPNKPIVVCTPPNRNMISNDAEFFEQKNSLGLYIHDYANSLSNLCKLYSIPIVDMQTGLGVNKLTMGGYPNLYNPLTTTDNFKLNSSGVLVADVNYFVSDFIPVTQGKVYGTPISSFFNEYSNGVFIRQYPYGTTCTLHPSTTHVRLSVIKGEQVLQGTTVGTGKDRFWFADIKNALMQDRVHPNSTLQKRMSERVANVLEMVLNSNPKPNEINSATYFNNAD